MDERNVLALLRLHYAEDIQTVELFRDGGNQSFTVYGASKRYFLKTVRAPYLETALESTDIQLYLLRNEFPVIPIVFTQEGAPYVRISGNESEYLFILYDFIDGVDLADQDTGKAGELVGRLHRVMQGYPGRLMAQGKHFFIDRYIEIMRKLHYPKAEQFRALGDEAWDKVKNLPRGYCHCDLYDGNIYKSDTGVLYVVDFDTSCAAFPMYDAVLFCNRTHYFEFEPEGYEKSQTRLSRFLEGYLRHSSLTAEEQSAFNDFLTVYHFQLQATIHEIHGCDTSTFGFWDRQYDWLICWKEQCAEMSRL